MSDVVERTHSHRPRTQRREPILTAFTSSRSSTAACTSWIMPNGFRPSLTRGSLYCPSCSRSRFLPQDVPMFWPTRHRSRVDESTALPFCHVPSRPKIFLVMGLPSRDRRRVTPFPAPQNSLWRHLSASMTCKGIPPNHGHERLFTFRYIS